MASAVRVLGAAEQGADYVLVDDTLARDSHQWQASILLSFAGSINTFQYPREA